MYISAEAISEIEQRYGAPDEIELRYDMSVKEFDMVRRSQKFGRAHDVTLFIVWDGRIVVIKKPMYPDGAYRAPSGGIAPGERFEDGAVREAYEETGLRVALEKYLLRARVSFICGEEVILWTTHVFAARRVSGTLEPVDTHEIVEARLATVEELSDGVKRALIESGSTGLKYRAELNDLVVERLKLLGFV